MARILVVDDHPTDRELLVTLLGYAGHSLVQAGDGAEALELLQGVLPDLILSDIIMPTMDGVTFVTRLRADPRLRSLPVIFNTASYRMAEAQALAGRCGVARVLPKPCQPREILDAVHEALGLAPFDPEASGPSRNGRRPEPRGYPHDLHELNAHIAAIVAHGTELVEREGPIHMATGELSVTLGRLEEVSLRLSALLEVGMDLAKERDPLKLLELFCRAAQHVVSARYAVLGILDDSDGGLRHLVCHGISALAPAAMPPQPEFLRCLLRDGHPRRVAGAGEDPARWGLPSELPPLGSLLAVPLVSPRRVLGWLFLADRMGAEGFSQEDESLASTLGAQMAMAYENLQLVEALQAEIRQRARAEEARIRLMEIVESSEDAIVTLDPGLRILTWNRGAEQIFSYPAEDACGQPYAMLVPPDLLDDYAAKAEALFKGRVLPVYETVRLTRGGAPVQMAVQTVANRDPRGACTGITAIMRDISGRRRVETSLLDTATKLQNVFNSIDEVVFSLDTANGQIIAISPACEQVYGHPPAAFFAQPDLWYRLVHPDDQPAAVEALAQLSQGLPIVQERRVIHPGGATRWVRVKANPLLDGAGRLIRIDGTVADITERWQAEQELRSSEARFRSLVESMEDTVLTLDLDLRFTGMFGRGAQRMVGLSSALLGEPVAGLLPAEWGPDCLGILARVLQEGPRSFEVKNPAGRHFRVSAAPIQGDAGQIQGIVAVANDITDILAIQERLSQQERLASLGTLVGTVAHDLRNPLTGIILGMERLEPHLAGLPEAKPALGCLRKGVGRMETLVNELLDFAHPRPLALQPWKVADLVREVVEDCEYLAAETGARVDIRFGDGDRVLALDGPRMHQVLKNLLENALQHSPPGGQVHIRGRADPAADHTYLLTVEDEGKGIAPENLARIFEPFFTCRPGGTGLGLAICRRIVDQHGGSIGAENRTEGGAQLCLRLPADGPQNV